MSENKRLLKKTPSYYETAMQQSNNSVLFNQSPMQRDVLFRFFWSRYIHYSNQVRIPANRRFHAHSFFEVHCILNGTFEYVEKDGTTKQLTKGQFVMIAPHNTHSFKSLVHEGETFAVTFEPICDNTEQGNKIKAQFDSLTFLTGKVDSEACQLIELVLQEFHDDRAFCSDNVTSLLSLLIIDLIRDLFVKKEEKITEYPHDARLVHLEKYIADNPSRIFTVEELAEYLNISSRQLNNIIKNDLGMSAKSFIDNMKTRQARRLLLESDLDLHQISEQLGFSDHNNFNRFFKRNEGLSPGLFRLSKGNFRDKKE